MEKINQKIELKRKEIKFFKELYNLFEAGALNKVYFERNIQRATHEQYGLVEAYNTLMEEESE